MIYVVFALIGLLVYQDFMNRKQVKRLMEAFLAKNLQELKQEPTKPVVRESEEKPEDIPLDKATPEQFDLAIKKELGTEPVLEKFKDRVKAVIRSKNAR